MEAAPKLLTHLITPLPAAAKGIVIILTNGHSLFLPGKDWLPGE